MCERSCLFRCSSLANERPQVAQTWGLGLSVLGGGNCPLPAPFWVRVALEVDCVRTTDSPLVKMKIVWIDQSQPPQHRTFHGLFRRRTVVGSVVASLGGVVIVIRCGRFGFGIDLRLDTDVLLHAPESKQYFCRLPLQRIRIWVSNTMLV